MKIKSMAFILMLLTVSLYTISCTKEERLYASNGIYDISDIDKDVVYSLRGEWGYAEKEFISAVMPIRACQENCVNGYVRISRLEPVCQIV